jgi:hypothetical protein
MRPPVLALFLIIAALIGKVETTYAQSPTSYPWCAIYEGGTGSDGARSCYYSSRAQCMATMSGIGGRCIQSPYYHSEPAPLFAERPRSHSHRRVGAR